MAIGSLGVPDLLAARFQYLTTVAGNNAPNIAVAGAPPADLARALAKTSKTRAAKADRKPR